MSINSHIVCRLLTPADVEEAATCITHTFIQGEPMVAALNISPAEFIHFTRLLISKAAQDGLSVIARNLLNNRLVGCIICEDLETGPFEGIETVSPVFNPIFALLDALAAHYRAGHSVLPGEVSHLFMGGVYAEYAGYGVAAAMTRFIEERVRSLGYKVAIGEVTGPVSQHIYIHRLQYKPLYSIRYQDFLYEGQAVFQGVTACESCILIHKDL